MSLFKSFFGSEKTQYIEFNKKRHRPYDFGCLIAAISFDHSIRVIEDGLLEMHPIENPEILSAISSNPLVTQLYVIPYLLSVYTSATLMLVGINATTAKEFSRGVEWYIKSSPFGPEVGEVMLSRWALFGRELLNELIAIKEQKMGFENMPSAKAISEELINGFNITNLYKHRQIYVNDSDLERLTYAFQSAAALTVKACMDSNLKIIM